MEITQEQYALIAHSLPVHRGNVGISNRQVLNTFLYVVEHGCKWRGLPQRFGNWHTIYTRISRCSKAGVLDRIVAALLQAHILRRRIEAVSLDSIDSKVDPDGTGALKKWQTIDWKVQRRMDHKTASGWRGCANGRGILFLARRAS